MSEKKVKVMFTIGETQKAKFKLQLQYDSMTQVKFFKSIIDGYIEKDEDLMRYMNKFKKENHIQSNEQRKKITNNIKQAKKVKKIFSLEDDEVENIFDILEKEHPEL